ncbi:hypothetical protein LY76DRAFT_650833 [Colletotrichum caudatum]|nr:hypothetical protein LY76DRAFT_650833 [Colletotrichum caudatum]
MTTGNFRYLDPATLGGAGSKPWAKVDADITSFSRTERRRSVANIRDAAGDFGTDVSGFAVHSVPAAEKDFTDDAAVRAGYYPEVEALLRAKLPGVRKVVIFDHTIRRRVKDSPRQPVQQVHVDQTPAAAEARETFSVAPSDKHKFYYAKDMTPDEAMFIKCFDSRSQGRPGGKPGVADYTPHTAFVDPNTPADAKGRQSIEVRCLVFYD